MKKGETSMSEKEYMIELLVCVPKRTLSLRISNPNSRFLPKWIRTTETEYVKEAVKVYNESKYKHIREENAMCL